MRKSNDYAFDIENATVISSSLRHIESSRKWAKDVGREQVPARRDFGKRLGETFANT